MKKIDSLQQLLSIKEEMQAKVAPRKLGDLHKDKVIEVRVLGNGTENYDEVKEIFNELNRFSQVKGYNNLRLKFEDNPNQKEKYIVDISSKIKATDDEDEFNKENIIFIIEHIADFINSKKIKGEDE